jgi:hypothetical protein
MIIVHYGHRLPANYDIGLIRKRAAGRGHLFDAIPELYFKAFLLRERGRFGAIASEYSSLYLWRKSEGFRNFLVEGRYKSVRLATVLAAPRSKPGSPSMPAGEAAVRRASLTSRSRTFRSTPI